MTYPDAPVIQLLKSDEFALFQARPEELRARIRQNKWSFVIIDEVQKIPQLLDEVHYLIEEDKVVFGLCGSSARKLRRGHANLLGGRAHRYVLTGLVSNELKDKFSLERMLNHGYMPAIYDADEPRLSLNSYCSDYLREEIYAEGLVRQLQPFTRFLEMAALGDTDVLNYQTVARDCGVSAPTVKSYYEILEDTLLARTLPAYIKRPKRRVTKASKFYFNDVGVVNQLAHRGTLVAKTPSWGKAFENWVFHELTAYIDYNQRTESLSYWQLSTGVEVDFIVGSMVCAIEAKSSDRINQDDLKGLRELKKDHEDLGSRYVVSMENYSRVTSDGIQILSYGDFTKRLWSGDLF